MPDFPSLRSCEALFHTFSDASAAHRRSDTGRYYSVWDLTIQVTSYMINPDLLHSKGKEAIPAKFTGLLWRRFSDGLCWQGRGQMRKLFVWFHSFCSENLFALVITYNIRISFIRTCFSAWPLFPVCAAVPARLVFMLSDCVRLAALIVYISTTFL